MKIECTHKYPQKFIDLIQPSPDGPFIAGGSALSIYEGNKILTDVDVFCTSQQQLSQVYERLSLMISLREKADHFTENAITIFGTDIPSREETTNPQFDFSYSAVEERFRIQLVRKNWFANPEEVISSFDLTICQIATDGVDWYATNKFLHSYETKTADVIKTDENTTKRLLKYWVRGYEPVSLDLSEVESFNFINGIY
jgi:hypothetical protein